MKHTYFLDGAKILRETWGENVIKTLWDNEDSLCGVKYNDVAYYFLKNLQGDVIAITDSNGDVVARYSYDAWGVPTIVSDTSDDNIATVNPFRYRGYYYDSETQLYYLQSRYYNPVVGRFVNNDEESYILCGIFNLFEYCYNSPINMTDSTGDMPSWLEKIIHPVKQYFSAQIFNLITLLPNVHDRYDKVTLFISLTRIIGNYLHNKKLESNNPMNARITNQWNYKNWKLGYSNMGRCGCEVISVYNVKYELGTPCSLADLILQFEICGRLMGWGFGGSNPLKLWECFAFDGILGNVSFGRTFSLSKFINKLKTSKCGIVSCWNDPFTTGVHTFMIKYDDINQKYVTYNGYSNSKYSSSGKTISDVIVSSGFIVGYWFN